jgi:hypothetical protein
MRLLIGAFIALLLGEASAQEVERPKLLQQVEEKLSLEINVGNLRSDKALDRKKAAEELGRMGPKAKSAVSALAMALADQDKGVREAAANALKAIQPGVQLPEVLSVLPIKVEVKDPSKGERSGTPGVRFVQIDKGVVLQQREKRMLRWKMIFDTKNGEDYVQQLDSLGVTMAVPVGENEYRFIADLKERPAKLERKELPEDRIFWFDSGRESVASLAKTLQLKVVPSYVVAFLPRKMEEELFAKELKHAGRKEVEISETTFKFVKTKDGYEIVVASQKPVEQTKKEPPKKPEGGRIPK